LGSSDYSAELAAGIGVGFAFAHHFATHDAIDPMRSYRARFTGSQWRRTPHAILAVAVVCADSDAEAERLAATVDLSFVRRARGEYLPLVSPEEALAYPYTTEERAQIRRNRARLFVGGTNRVTSQLTPLLEASAADELMITTMIYDHAARRRSYELLAQAYGLAPSLAQAARSWG
jgi:luciferase family oxidoreductase group 1